VWVHFWYEYIKRAMNVYSKIALLLLFQTLFSGTPGFANQEPEAASVTEAGSDTTVEESAIDATEPEEDQDSKKAKDPNRGRILPIPIFITEPAIGEGLGVVLAYFHRTKDAPERNIASPTSIASASQEQKAPPTVTGVFGAYTSNETAAAGVGHMNSFKDDHIRFTGVIALADIKSTFYLLDQPLKFNIKGAMLYQETRFRIKDSRWFLGIGLSYLDADNVFQVEIPEEAPIDLFRSEFQNAGLSAKLAWDSRDNTSMPNSGQLLDLALWRYDESIGGDFNYWNTKLKLLSFHQLHQKFVLAGRLEYSLIDGQAPFFAVPWVTLRGIPAMRYQGERVAVAEVEARYYFHPRWALIAFTGIGDVTSDVPGLDTEQDIYSYGIGARYNIFEAQDVWIGIDIAQGPEDTNWYIQIGQSW
jgi:hypothetical protein